MCLKYFFIIFLIEHVTLYFTAWVHCWAIHDPFSQIPFPRMRNFQVVQGWPVYHFTVTLQFVFWKWMYSLQITVHIVLFSCLCWFIIVVWLFLIFLCYILPCKWDSVHVYTCGVRQEKNTLWTGVCIITMRIWKALKMS